MNDLTELAVVTNTASQDVTTALPQQQTISFKNLVAMATYIAKAGLFGIKTVEQTVSIMLLAQAEGRHPVLAARDYHLMTFKDKYGGVGCMPTLKATTMLARLMEAGGSHEVLIYNDTCVSVKFTYKNNTPFTCTWDMDRIKKAEINNNLYRTNPAQMLFARCCSEGIKIVCPGILNGLYTPEEVSSFAYEDVEPAPPTLKEPMKITAVAPPAPPAPAASPAPDTTEAVTVRDGVDTIGTVALNDNYPAKIDSIENFTIACRVLIKKVKTGQLDKETAKRHYFIFCEDLAAIYEDVPETIKKIVENNIY